jgi:outer membrane protein OmpA-like peptidoglycan-associated protein
MMEVGPIMNLADDRTATRRASRARCITQLLTGLLVLPLVLGGCSAVPDWADPTDWFAPDQAPTRVGLSQGQGQAAYTQSTSFPNLASVPDTAPRVTSRAARAEIQDSLAADRANAQYTGERLVGAPSTGSPSPVATAPASQAAPVRPARVPKPPAQAQVPPAPGNAATAGAPPVPRIAADLVGPGDLVDQGQAPSAPAPARSQVAQVAQSAAGKKPQLRFPQFQGTQSPAPRLAALEAQLVAVIYFGHSSAQLDASDRGVLREVVALHRQRGGRIRVIGHASAHTGVVDQIKHRTANFAMSLKRANAVAAGLVALGAAKDEVRAEARGDAQPVFHEFMPTGEAGNRRTEIFLEN